MNSPFPAPEWAPRRNWTRRLVNVVVALVVIAVAAAAFVFSYDGVHAVALLGGMSPRLARYYPGLFDAVLVIACVAAIMLRDGRWWARLWAWLVFIVVLAAIGATDVLHAMGYTLRHRPTEGVVAGAPVVAVLLAFSLLLTLLRQPRTGHAVAPASLGSEPGRPAMPAPPGVHVLPAAVTIALPAAPETVAVPETVADPVSGQSAEAVAAPETVAVPVSGRPAEPAVAPTRDEPLPDDGPVLEHPVLEHPVLEPPVLERPVPDRPVLDPPVADRSAVDRAVAEAAAEASPVTPPDGLPVLRRPATEPTEVLTPAESVPAGPVPAGPAAAEQAAPEATADDTQEAAADPAAGTKEPAPEAAPVRPGIRYAGGSITGRTGRPVVADPDPSAAPAQPRDESGDYWDGEDGGPYAGLVYTAGTDSAQSDDAAADDADGPADDASDADADDSAAEPLPHRKPQPFNRDASPFGSAPFASVPRLNRVRSMPAPPADDEDE
jgi:hypothetical protein